MSEVVVNYGKLPGYHPAPMLMREVETNKPIPNQTVVNSDDWIAVYVLAYTRKWHIYNLVSVEILERHENV